MTYVLYSLVACKVVSLPIFCPPPAIVSHLLSIHTPQQDFSTTKHHLTTLSYLIYILARLALLALLTLTSSVLSNIVTDSYTSAFAPSTFRSS
jgi:hypothetical protein